MNIRPLYNRVLIERKEAPQKSKGGLILPSSSSKKPNQGTILAVGNGHLKDDGSLRPLQVKKDDLVVFGEYSGNKITLDGKEYYILSEEDILGIIEEKVQ